MLAFQRQMILTRPKFAINGETKPMISGQRETNFEELAPLARTDPCLIGPHASVRLS